MKKYQGFTIDELVLISLDSVLKKKPKCSFGELVKENFTLFPEAFSLTQFPKWPDSLKLESSLRRLRSKGFITGRPRTYFLLTRSGEKTVEALKVKQTKGKSFAAKKIKTRDPDSVLIQEQLESEDYRRFVRDKRGYKPSDMRLREIAKSTLQAPLSNVKDYLEYIIGLAENYGDRDLLEYLNIYTRFLKNKNK